MGIFKLIINLKSVTKISYPSRARTSEEMKESFRLLRRNMRFSLSRYSLDRILNDSVEESASSGVNESPFITRNAARNIWSPGGSETKNVSARNKNNIYIYFKR